MTGGVGIVLALTLLAASCAGSDDVNDDGRPHGLTATSVEIASDDGSITTCCMWLADSSAERSRGLMGVTDLDGAAGMLFVYPNDVDHQFFMVDTPIPLSIAFFDADGGFISSAEMDPCLDESTAACPRYTAAGHYRYALEVRQGELGELGVGRGARLTPVAGSETESCRRR